MKCYKCSSELDFKVGEIIGRSAECAICRSDVRCCCNCKFYDSKSYNECGEPQAERVVEKGRANFCDYFSLGREIEGNSTEQTKEDTLKKLNDLFL
jgi:hypothetical protein